MFALLTSCDERRYEQWEQVSWWEFTGAEGKSEQFKKFLVDGMTRTLVAAQAKKMSARTGGSIATQIMLDMVKVNGHVDRVLDGPTSEVWIDPWTELPHRARRRHFSRAARSPTFSATEDMSSVRRSMTVNRSSRPTTTWRRCPSRSCAR